MAQTVRFDGDEVDRLIEMVKERKAGVLSGAITGFGQPLADEVSDLDAILYKLGEDE